MSDHAPEPPDLDTVHLRVNERLRAVGQRYTSGRRRLVDALVHAGRPVTVPEMGDMDVAVPQSSVYRNLEVLERSGLVRRIAMGSEHARYELAEPILGHHHHLVCVDCGRIEDITLDDELEAELDAALHRIAEQAAFTPRAHTLDLHGLCAECTGEPDRS